MRLTACMALFLYAAVPLTANASFFDDDAPPPSIQGAGASFDTAFAPGPLSPSIVQAILSAKHSIRIAARDFTSKPVSEALVKASRSKVDVKVLLNKKTNENVYSAGRFLMTMDIVPHLTKADDMLYDNFIIIDDHDLILGNIANFTDEEDEKANSGSIVIIHNAPDLAKRYLDHWQKQWSVSEDMKPEKN